MMDSLTPTTPDHDGAPKLMHATPGKGDAGKLVVEKINDFARAVNEANKPIGVACVELARAINEANKRATEAREARSPGR